jgi:ATP/maltotriose-dependent transcriptional regulator MalT
VSVHSSRERHRPQESTIRSSSDQKVDPFKIVLKPKLRAPSAHPELLARPRLLKLLEASSDCRLTLVSAPAGYGKTTLLAQRRQDEAESPFAWVSVDEQDNDPVRLWRHIVEAIRQAVSTMTRALRCQNENDGSAERNREAVE